MHSIDSSEPETEELDSPASAVINLLCGAGSVGPWMLGTTEAQGVQITYALTRTTATPSDPTATASELAAQLITALASFDGLGLSESKH